MIKTIYVLKTIISEVERSPFRIFVHQLANDYLEKGYKPKSVQESFRALILFIRWAAHNSLSPGKLKKEHVSDFMKTLRLTGHGQHSCARRFFHLIENKFQHVLIERNLPHYQRNPSVMASVSEFEKHMKNDRGLTPSSIVRFKTTIGQFLTHAFPTGKFNAKKLSSKNILDFLRERGKRFQDKTLRCDGSAIKCYMRFLYGRGLTKIDLSFSVPSISCWRNKNVIHTSSEDEMMKILMSCNLDEHVGVSDYAILLLLMRYGLRPIEVIRLNLQDIDWREKKITIKGKGGKDSILPLEPDVAESIKRYMEVARPLTWEKKLFVRCKAPFTSLEKSAAISSIVKNSIIRAGLDTQIYGAKLLRYSVASMIINRGGSLREVSELLRHTSMNTSARYTRLDFNRLKLVALAWPTKWEESV